VCSVIRLVVITKFYCAVGPVSVSFHKTDYILPLKGLIKISCLEKQDYRTH
jgi:hypothetical protein